MMVKEVIKNLYALNEEQKAAIADLVQLAMWAVDPNMGGAFVQGFNLLLEPLGLKMDAENATHLKITEFSMRPLDVNPSWSIFDFKGTKKACSEICSQPKEEESPLAIEYAKLDQDALTKHYIAAKEVLYKRLKEEEYK